MAIRQGHRTVSKLQTWTLGLYGSTLALAALAPLVTDASLPHIVIVDSGLVSGAGVLAIGSTIWTHNISLTACVRHVSAHQQPYSVLVGGTLTAVGTLATLQPLQAEILGYSPILLALSIGAVGLAATVIYAVAHILVHLLPKPTDSPHPKQY